VYVGYQWSAKYHFLFFNSSGSDFRVRRVNRNRRIMRRATIRPRLWLTWKTVVHSIIMESAETNGDVTSRARMRKPRWWWHDKLLCIVVWVDDEGRWCIETDGRLAVTPCRGRDPQDRRDDSPVAPCFVCTDAQKNIYICVCVCVWPPMAPSSVCFNFRQNACRMSVLETLCCKAN